MPSPSSSTTQQGTTSEYSSELWRPLEAGDPKKGLDLSDWAKENSVEVRRWVVVIVMSLSACGRGEAPDATSSPDSPEAPVSMATSRPPVPTPSLTFSTRSPTPTATSFALGETVETTNGNFVTVYSWNPNADRPVEPPSGQQWSSIDFKFCTGPSPQGGSLDATGLPSSFTLEMADSRTMQWDGSTYGNTGEITGRLLAPNDCIRGLVIYASPKGQKPRNVVFASSSVVKWRVP